MIHWRLTIGFACPICRRPLEAESDAWRCAVCRRLFPLVFGIPDFRVTLPPHFNRARDIELARALAEAEHDLDFEGLLHLYYKLNPEATDALHETHMAHLAGEEDQARAALELIEERHPLEGSDAVLEVGCGLGQYLAIAAERADRAVGVDLWLPFLILARKRLGGRGIFAAAEAERLPFAGVTFAGVIAADVIEHLADQEQSVAEMARVLKPGGALFLSTPNRFSLTPEPHVGLWGVGFLPRSWANRYVRRRRGIFYDDVRLLSAAALRRLLRRRFPGRASVLLPGLGPRQLKLFSPRKRWLAFVYLALRRTPLVRTVFYLLGPFFHVVAEKQ